MAMAVLPVCRSPRINSRWPRPTGMSASMTLRPVWSGTVTAARAMMASGGAFGGQTLGGRHRAEAVERTAERVDDASEQGVAHGHVHDPARAPDLVAGVQARVVAEQHDAEFGLVHVEHDAEDAAGKLDQFLEADVGQTRDHGDAGVDAGDRADLARRQLRRERFPRVAQGGERPVENGLEALGFGDHEVLSTGFGSAGFDAGSSAGLSFGLSSSPTPFSNEAR